MFVYTLNKGCLNRSLMHCTCLCRNILDFFQQSFEPVFYHRRIYLISHNSCGSSCSPGIDKCKRTVIPHFTHHIQSILEILFRFARESYNNICCKGNIRHSFPYFSHQLKILFFCISAIHFLKNPGTSGLNRQMKMAAYLFRLRHYLYQFV